MTRAEQLARRALKLERKAIERAVTRGALRIHCVTTTRMSYQRRIAENARAVDHAYRDAGARIAAIGRELRGEA